MTFSSAQPGGNPSIGSDGLLSGLNPAPMPFGYATVAAMVEQLGGTAPALADSGATLSYEQLRAAVAAAAAALRRLGLAPGDRIAASGYNHNGMIIAFLAAQWLGLVWVGINRNLAPAEKYGQLKDCGARLLLADPLTAAVLTAEPGRARMLEHVLTSSADPATDWPLLIAEYAGQNADKVSSSRVAPAAIAYTSGTTGLPKGAVHTQHSIMSFVNAGLFSDRGGIWQPGLRRSVTIALTILNGMTYGPLTALAGGGCFVSMDRTDSAGVAEWIARAGINILCCTPPTIRDILSKPDLQDTDIGSLRYVLAGGADGANELRVMFKDRVGSELIDEYGLTEAPSGVAGSRCDKLPPLGSVGQVYPHVEIAALDGDAAPLPPGTVGEIALRARQEGPWARVFTGTIGYWNQPEETARAIRGGWLCTGDLGMVDAAGNLSIVGRLKDLIIRGGANIYPAEVERVLRKVDDVEDAVIVGMPDDRLGEIVCSFVKLRKQGRETADLADRLALACAAELARYKVPERWFVVDDIPRNAMNKPLRARLLDMPRQELHRR